MVLQQWKQIRSIKILGPEIKYEIIRAMFLTCCWQETGFWCPNYRLHFPPCFLHHASLLLPPSVHNGQQIVTNSVEIAAQSAFLPVVTPDPWYWAECIPGVTNTSNNPRLGNMGHSLHQNSEKRIISITYAALELEEYVIEESLIKINLDKWNE